MESKGKVKIGTVISDKMDKTVVVRIDRVKAHPIYKKKFVVSNNLKAHDEKNEYKTNDLVEIQETKPISKDKKFVVTRKVK
jgi:small subunit ribosomal protein S17